MGVTLEWNGYRMTHDEFLKFAAQRLDGHITLKDDGDYIIATNGKKHLSAKKVEKR